MSRRNLINNPSFENNVTDNTGFDNNTGGSVTLTRDATTAQVGSASAKLAIPSTATTDDWAVKIKFNTTTGAPIESGKTYRLSFYAKASKAHPIKAEFVNAGSYYPGTKNLTTSWARYDYEITASATGNLEFRFLCNDGSAVDIWFDAILFEESATLEDYFDGDTSGYEWEGTAHNSFSTTTLVSRKGFVYDTVSRADPEDTSPEASLYANVQDVGLLENATYSYDLTGLTAETTYYFRAFGYDVNTDVYAYGDELTFTTYPTPSTVLYKGRTGTDYTHKNGKIILDFQLSAGLMSVVYRYVDDNNYWKVLFDADSNKVFLIKKVSGVETTVATNDFVFSGTHKFWIRHINSIHECMSIAPSKSLIHKATDSAHDVTGKVGLVGEGGTGGMLRVDSIAVGKQ